MDVYVCIPWSQASMMSAENDPLGPLPPGWGEFTFSLLNIVHVSMVLVCAIFFKGTADHADEKSIEMWQY